MESAAVFLEIFASAFGRKNQESAAVFLEILWLPPLGGRTVLGGIGGREWHLGCSVQLTEVSVSRRTLGILATVAGSAIGWWWTTQRRSAVSKPMPGRDHGVVIFDNTPTVSENAVDF